MKRYLLSVIINLIMGSFSLNPIIFGLIIINGGVAIFGPAPKPTTTEVLWGITILFLILLIVITVNLAFYNRSRKEINNRKLFAIIAVISYLCGLLSFIMGIYAPDIFNIM